MSLENFIKKEWKEHKNFKTPDGYYCHEQDVKHTKIISDVHCFENGKEWIKSKEEAQKEMEQEKCEFCEFCRKLLKQIKKEAYTP